MDQERKMIFGIAHSNKRYPRVLNQCSRFSFIWNMRIQFLLRDIILLFAFLGAISASGEDHGLLQLEKEIPLPGVEGRIDQFSADVAGQRLFIPALENGSVEILDTRQGERIAEIKGLEEPQGVYYESKNGPTLCCDRRRWKASRVQRESAQCARGSWNLVMTRTTSDMIG
jgi:hypothetical protein